MVSMDAVELIIRAIENISVTEDVNNFWQTLPNDLRIATAERIQGRAKDLLVTGIFTTENFFILDILITPDIIDRDLQWTKRANYNRQDIEWELRTPAHNNHMYRYDVTGAFKPLIVVAFQEDRDDLIEFLLERNARIQHDLLELFADDDKLQVVIDHANLDDNVLVRRILSVITRVEDFVRLANHNIFIGYEKAEFDELGIISPIENMIQNENTQNLATLIEYGLRVEPDATYYFLEYPWIFVENENLINLFVRHGGDRNVLN